MALGSAGGASQECVWCLSGERSCLAGVSPGLPCRLAATPLAPGDTLQYLVNQKPYERHFLMARINFNF